jgi:23S rRNA pseudouridine2605 synthase
MTRHERPGRGAARPEREADKQRVQKALARAGVASRRQAELLIAEGRVRVGGKRVDKQGVLVDPRRDTISVDGRRIEAEPLVYLLFHKPREVMCTMSDPAGRPAVTQYLRGVRARVVPVGRLDYQTSGVLLLTNDGDLARELLHPSHGVVKEYLLKLKGGVDADGLQRLRERIQIAGKATRPARVERVRADDNNTWLAVTLQEGKNRQVRRLAEHAGYRVMRLTRTRFAGLTTEGLRPGQWRELSAAELRTLRAGAAPDASDPAQDAGSAARERGPRPARRAPRKSAPRARIAEGKRGPKPSPLRTPRSSSKTEGWSSARPGKRKRPPR